MKGGRLLRSKEATRSVVLLGRDAWRCVCGGMMKRKIFETIRKIRKKFVLILLPATLAAINAGFTDQENLPVPQEIQAEETSATPTAIAVDENGKIKVSEEDELSRAFADVVAESLNKNPGTTVDEPFASPEKISPPENFVETPQGSLAYTKVFGMEATAYLPTDGSSEGLTAMGIPARYGIVAVDPDVIPLGSKVYIPGYGTALAADTGGAIYGYKIDLCMEDYYQAMDFGRRTVTVFVLK